MFDLGDDQAAGLRSRPVPRPGPRVMPVASPAQPARAYELLCTLAAHLAALDHAVVIVDGTATETPARRHRDGAHLGLLHALQDASIAGLEQPADQAEWLVMPAALGLQALQQTARLAGPEVALARLLAPFAAGVLVLLFAPPQALVPVLAGLPARVLVPVLDQPQATIDAYGALKLLHAGGLSPVLAPLPAGDGTTRMPLQQAVDTVSDCAQRHLGLAVDAWPLNTWGLRVEECALGQTGHHTGRSRSPGTTHQGHSPGLAVNRRAAASQTLWS